MTDTRTARREDRIRSLVGIVPNFNPFNPTHAAHFATLAATLGDLTAAMIVSRDADLNGANLKVTDPGEIGTWAQWKDRNRVVRHGEVSEYSVYDFQNDRIVPLFTRDQTVPVYEQPE